MYLLSRGTIAREDLSAFRQPAFTPPTPGQASICVSYIRQYMPSNSPYRAITDSSSLAPQSPFPDTAGSHRRFAAIVALAFCLVARVMSSAACLQALLPHSLVPLKLSVSSTSIAWCEGRACTSAALAAACLALFDESSVLYAELGTDARVPYDCGGAFVGLAARVRPSPWKFFLSSLPQQLPMGAVV